MTQESSPELELRPLPLRQTYRRLVVAGPVVGLILLLAAGRVVMRAALDGVGALPGALIVVLVAGSAVAWLGLSSRQRSRRQRVRYADGRLTVTDRRGRAASVRPTAATAHPVLGSKGGSVLLVVSGTAQETPVLLRAEHWDWQTLDDKVFRPAGFTIAVAPERDSRPRALRTAYPGLRLPFSVARPVLFGLLAALAVIAVIAVIVTLVSLPYLTAGNGS
ncbi:hypothetical protein ACIRVF_22145 [Kitasatospora sp. NPDC101157]|uniref:hypothetical protein n=1 Tax=Kitasatospora sp. NPDC101157 TaxID=3364098 RepID=UPI0037F30FE7